MAYRTKSQKSKKFRATTNSLHNKPVALTLLQRNVDVTTTIIWGYDLLVDSTSMTVFSRSD